MTRYEERKRKRLQHDEIKAGYDEAEQAERAAQLRAKYPHASDGAIAFLVHAETNEAYRTAMGDLASIRDDAHLDEAVAVLHQLLDQPTRSAAEEAYLLALTDLVEQYEHAHVVIPPVSGVDALRYLMEENGLTQTDLVPLFGTPAMVSEVLSGTRRLSLSHIQRLSAHFGLPADVFLTPVSRRKQSAKRDDQ